MDYSTNRNGKALYRKKIKQHFAKEYMVTGADINVSTDMRELCQPIITLKIIKPTDAQNLTKVTI